MKRKILLFIMATMTIVCISVASEKKIRTIQKTPTAHEILGGDLSLCKVPTKPVQTKNLTVSSYFSGLFATENWPARWTCGEWSQTEGWLYISSDLSIFLAYLSIPIMLLWFIRKHQIGKLKWLVALFGAFILLCGFTHLIDAILFWEPMYRLSGFTKMLTGIVSLVTATVLGFVIPKALEFKRPEILQSEVNEKKGIQNRFELFVKHSPGAIAMLDNDMNYLMVNDGWYKDYGLVGQEIIGKCHYDVFPEIREMPNWLEDHRRALSGETLKKDLDVFVSGDSTTYLSWKLTPWEKADGSIGGIMMFTEILTDEVSIKNILEESETRFKNIFEKAMIGIALVDSEGKPFLVNDQLCVILDYEKEELCEMAFTEFTHPEDIEKDWDLYTKLLNKEIDSYTIEKRYYSKSGNIVFANLNVTLVDLDSNQPYALAMVEDVTKTELALRKGKESEQKAQMFNNLFAEISSIAKIGTWEVSLSDGKCLWSFAVYEIHEEDPRKEIKIEDGINYYHPDDQETIQEAINKSIAEEIAWDLELRIITAKGNEKWVRAIGRPIFKDGEVIKLQGLFQDIDKEARQKIELKQKTENLTFMNEQFDLARDASEFGIWDWDVINNDLKWDHQMFKLYGFSQSDFGSEYEAWQKGLHPDDGEKSHNEVQDALSGKKKFDTQFRVMWPNGEVRHLRAMAKVFFENEKPVRMLGTNWDITRDVEREAKIVELNNNLQEQVELKTQDLKTTNEELEAFSYSVSHDLRAPLRAINGFSEALIEDYLKILPDDAQQYINRISTNSSKMGKLIDDLLEFSRMNRKQVDFYDVNLNDLVSHLVKDLFIDATDFIKIDTLPTVRVDKEMVGQVFVNLISNAIKYSSKETNPSIHLSAHEEEHSYVISVKDNGVGFNMDYSDKLFQVFQRLHSESEFEGTGVGLSLCGKIMKAHKGDIWAEAKEGKGATFYLRFNKILE